MNFLTENYHTHTTRCGHAEGTDREYIEAAIKAGIQVLGFSDHTPMPFPSGLHSPHRIQPDMAQDYFDSLTALREEYRDKIEIHIGVETEYYPETFDGYLAYMQQFPVEYIVLGQHFLWREEDNIGAFSKTDDVQRLHEFYENMLMAVDTGKFLYIAHPDVVRFIGDDEDYERETRAFLQEIYKRDVVLGINRYGMADRRNYPRPLFWQLAGEIGCRGIIELDAHSPDVFADEKSVRECKELADACGVELVQSLHL